MTDLSVDIDFIVLNTTDDKMIGIGDKSHYGVAENLPAYLIVTPPGSKRHINLSFPKHNLMFLTSVNLGLSCVDACQEQKLQPLDDGVWEFCLKSGYQGLEKKRYYLKTDSLRLEMDKMYIKEGIAYNEDSKVVRSLEKAEWLLNVAHAEMRQGNKPRAMKAFEIACKEVDKFKHCKNCR